MLTVRYNELKSELCLLEDKIIDAITYNTKALNLKKRILQCDDSLHILINY